MSKVRVAGFSVSLDGFSAGIEQSLNDPLGKRGTDIFLWYFRTSHFAPCTGRKVELSVPTMSSPTKQWTTLAPSFWDVICSAQCAGHGWITHGRAGGATIRHIMRQLSF